MSCESAPKSAQPTCRKNSSSPTQTLLQWGTKSAGQGRRRCAKNQHWVSPDNPYCKVCAGMEGVTIQQASASAGSMVGISAGAGGHPHVVGRGGGDQPIPENPPDKCPVCGASSLGAWACPNCHSPKVSVGYAPADLAIALGHHPLYNPIIERVFADYTHVILGQRRQVHVVPGQTSTDMRGNIYIDTMVLGPDKGVPKNLATAFGGAEHEVGHEKHTPIKVYEQILALAGHCPKCGAFVSPNADCTNCGKYHRPPLAPNDPLGDGARAVLTDVYNILEDGRMERCVQAQDPYGFRLIEAEAALLMTERVQPWTRQLDPWTRLSLAMLYEGLPTTQVPKALVSQMTPQEKTLWENELQPRVWKAVRGSPKMCAEITQEIAQILEREGIVKPQTQLPAWFLIVRAPSAGAKGSGQQASGQQAGGQQAGGQQASGQQAGGQQAGGQQAGGQQAGGQQAGGQQAGGQQAGGQQAGGQQAGGQAGGDQAGGQAGGGKTGGGKTGRQAGGQGQRQCPRCGKFMAAGADTCPHCGAASADTGAGDGSDAAAGDQDGDQAGDSDDAKGGDDASGAASGDADSGDAASVSGDSQLPGVPPHGGTGSGNSPQAWDQAFQPGTWESVATIQADVGGQYARGVTTEARRSAKTFGKQVGKKKNGQVTVPTLDGAGATTFELQSIPPNRAVRSLNADDLGVVRTMVGRLRALQNQARQPKTQQRAGRLDRTRLTAAVKGDTRVFRKPGGLGRGKSRAWSVVLDASVSMGGLAHKVRQATGIIGETLHTVNDPFEITEFGGQNEVIGVNKTFDEPWSPGQAYAYNPYGNTYYTDALTRAAYSLSGRDEEAKIMFFITDGGPSEEYDEIRKNVVEPIRRQGIILIPVFLGPAQSAQSIYDEIFGSRQWIAVPNLQNLPRLVYEYLEKYFVTD